VLVSVLSQECPPGAESILFIENSKLEEWPESGFGILNYQSADLQAFFEYKKRVHNRIFLKSSLKKHHEFGVDIRTSNFSGRSKNISAQIDTCRGALFGAFGLKVPIVRDNMIELQKD